MKINYKEFLDNNLSVNSYLWPNDRNPFEFIETIVKSRIKNIGLHTDFINNFGVNKLKQELTLNKINVTSINSVGYFTDPYYFKQNEPIEVIIKTMLDQFSINIWQPFQKETRFKNLRYTFHELLTLSSMIQKESRVITEMPMISSVFYNRLKKRMRLASDPTVVYALGKSYKDRVYYKDLKIKSPYNTYRVGGFPPTPIAAVGLDAFRAACFPETSPYLFFVAKPDGSHYFSRTYQEHLAIQRKLKKQKSK